jgi:predicted pyridoxine 5'-phosphate oxidase superfamily flavin-nucleotide-binding protein
MGLFNEGSRGYQDRFDTRRLADRIDERLVRDWIDDDDRAFVERCDMLFIATADAAGRPQCSYKGGEPGFVRVVDEHTIAFPNYDGNGMFLSAGNALVNPQLRGTEADAAERRRRARRRRPAARRVPGSTVPVARASNRSLPELPSLHPPLQARRALALRAEGRVRDAGARVEAARVGA